MLCDSDDIKFIIFSYHRLMTDGIVEQLIESKVKFIRIDGSTVVQDRPVKFIYSFSDNIPVINYYYIAKCMNITILIYLSTQTHFLSSPSE